MKKKLFLSVIAIGVLSLSFACSDSARAQVPGSIFSVSALGGAQTSSLSGIGSGGLGSGDFFALRGSFTSLFLELRHVDWGSGNAAVHENGVLVGGDASLFHILVSGAVGFGASTSQGPVSALSPSTNISSYNSFDYDAQAQYQFEIVAGAVTLGVGINYVGESNSVAPISGWGLIGSVSVGL
jgi:hypothetical protein